ncbi:hypothetical protein RM549_06265 [Salegentibacter sp. F188]|uniref:Late embryogenesis abundant protein LEA-2 subgroup domain-containing protein n=1 Tax=Autumnicola patrickiae TaxID=3075591 RepID=A0ABU3E282_9FLAO|nr:hypothetical protein [Salegentibacter sp. F188]MDT0689382.1 hypothetical protein [Salegentibacter sp. F188]
MNIKTILSVGALAITGFSYFGKGKYDEYREVADRMEFNLKNVKIHNPLQGTLKVNVEIVNPTATAVTVPGNLITIKNIHFYTLSGKKLGTAKANISDISLPANSSREIQNIPVQLSLANIGNSFSEVLEIAQDTDKLKISADIQAFGKSFTVNA